MLSFSRTSGYPTQSRQPHSPGTREQRGDSDHTDVIVKEIHVGGLDVVD
jgi:hypothetical protein